MSNFWLEDGHTMLFIGDSITDCGRRGDAAPLGNGYVRCFTELVTAHFPERHIDYINTGIGGNRITDLKGRWQEDVLAHKPDRLSIKIGINDLHSHLRGDAGSVSPELFAEIYQELLELTAAELGCPIVLITPFYISTDHGGQNPQSQVLDLLPRYIETVEVMSQAHNTRLLKLQDLFQQHLTYRTADVFCPEPVHPNHTGHTIMAQALLDNLNA